MVKHKFNWETVEGVSTMNVLGTKPLMTEKELDYIVSQLKSDNIMFEWGSGGSTLYFPKFVKKYYSVETQDHWYRFVRNKLRAQKEIKDKVNLKFIPQNKYYSFEEYPVRDEFTDYIEYIGKTGEKRYDRVLIDGINKSRTFCMEECLKYIDKDSIVFIHDYTYKEGLKTTADKLFNIIHVEDTLAACVKK